MDLATFASAFGNQPGVDYSVYLDGFHDACAQAGWTTVARVAMVCAQVGEESQGLRYTEELADGAEYNWRNDLGNTAPGDGPRFKGRSFIQITGRHNYGALTNWAYNRKLVPNPHYFLDFPERLAQPRYCWLGPVWYWTQARPGLNSAADNHDVTTATRMVNGGLNGITDRVARWKHAMGLGAALLQEDDLNQQQTQALIDASLRDLAFGTTGPRHTSNPHIAPDPDNGIFDLLTRLGAGLSAVAKQAKTLGVDVSGLDKDVASLQGQINAVKAQVAK